ncbi:hypothetical protein V8C37DRAFT_395318 [Trichoderma ceciliae]
MNACLYVMVLLCGRITAAIVPFCSWYKLEIGMHSLLDEFCWTDGLHFRPVPCAMESPLGHPHDFTRSGPINQQLRVKTVLRMRNMFPNAMQSRTRTSRSKYRGGPVWSTGRLHPEVCKHPPLLQFLPEAKI